jgi:hypothetical protein
LVVRAEEQMVWYIISTKWLMEKASTANGVQPTVAFSTPISRIEGPCRLLSQAAAGEGR